MRNWTAAIACSRCRGGRGEEEEEQAHMQAAGREAREISAPFLACVGCVSSVVVFFIKLPSRSPCVSTKLVGDYD